MKERELKSTPKFFVTGMTGFVGRALKLKLLGLKSLEQRNLMGRNGHKYNRKTHDYEKLAEVLLGEK